jgi:hypothetical protein
MRLLTMKSSMRNEQRKVAILYAHISDFGIHVRLDLFPDKVRPWSKNVTTRDIVVFDELSFTDDLIIEGIAFE